MASDQSRASNIMSSSEDFSIEQEVMSRPVKDALQRIASRDLRPRQQPSLSQQRISSPSEPSDISSGGHTSNDPTYVSSVEADHDSDENVTIKRNAPRWPRLVSPKKQAPSSKRPGNLKRKRSSEPDISPAEQAISPESPLTIRRKRDHKLRSPIKIQGPSIRPSNVKSSSPRQSTFRRRDSDCSVDSEISSATASRSANKRKRAAPAG